jgi:hypothetical protein
LRGKAHVLHNTCTSSDDVRHGCQHEGGQEAAGRVDWKSHDCPFRRIKHLAWRTCCKAAAARRITHTAREVHAFRTFGDITISSDLNLCHLPDPAAYLTPHPLPAIGCQAVCSAKGQTGSASCQRRHLALHLTNSKHSSTQQDPLMTLKPTAEHLCIRSRHEHFGCCTDHDASSHSQSHRAPMQRPTSRHSHDH